LRQLSACECVCVCVCAIVEVAGLVTDLGEGLWGLKESPWGKPSVVLEYT